MRVINAKHCESGSKARATKNQNHLGKKSIWRTAGLGRVAPTCGPYFEIKKFYAYLYTHAGQSKLKVGLQVEIAEEQLLHSAMLKISKSIEPSMQEFLFLFNATASSWVSTAHIVQLAQLEYLLMHSKCRF